MMKIPRHYMNIVSMRLIYVTSALVGPKDSTKYS